MAVHPIRWAPSAGTLERTGGIAALLTVAVLLALIARRLHTLANQLAGLPHSITTQFVIIYTRNFDVNINAVEQGTGDFRDVALNLRRRTMAIACGIAEEAAGLRIFLSLRRFRLYFCRSIGECRGKCLIPSQKTRVGQAINVKGGKRN